MQNQRELVNPLRAFGRLERRLLAIIFPAIIAPIIILSVIAFYLIGSAFEQKEAASQTDLATSVSDKMERFLFERYGDVQVVASNPLLLVNNANRVVILNQVAQTYKVYPYITYVGTDGKVLAATDPNTIGRDMSGTNWYRTTSANFQVNVEGPVTTTETGDKRVLLFSAPVFGLNKAFEGVANLRMDFGVVDKIMSDAKFGNTGILLLLDKDGTLLAGPNGVGSSRANLPAFKEALTKKTGYTTGDSDTKNQIFGFSVEKGHEDYKGLGWVTIAQQDTSEAFAAVNNLRAIGLGIGFLALLVAVAVAVFVARYISRPLLTVSEAAKAISRGELRQNLEVKRNDEIGSLYHYFNDMTRYLTEMATTASTIAVGDLTTEVKPRSDKDVLGNAFAEMLKNLRSSVAQVYTNAIQVSTASGELSQAAGQTGSVVQQIARTIQQVARGAQEQSQSVSSTSESTLQLAHAIEQVTHGSQEQNQIVDSTTESVHRMSQVSERLTGSSKAIASVAARAAMAAEMGSQSVLKTIQGMEAIRSSVTNSSLTIQQLGEKSNQIGVIVETIDDIADQTNLLALNAAIEAARAGEHGRGFAVVADAVRSLAERASKSTKEISVLINTVRKATEAAVQTMEQGTREVETGARLAQEAGRSLDSIMQEVSATNREVSQISTAADEMRSVNEELVRAFTAVSGVAQQNSQLAHNMDGNSRDVIQAIENIAVVSEENSAAAEEVSAATEEMSAQIQEMVASAEGLTGMSDNLLMVVARFRLEENYLDNLVNNHNGNNGPFNANNLAMLGVTNPFGGNGHGEKLN